MVCVGSIKVMRQDQPEDGGSNPTPTLQKSEWTVKNTSLKVAQAIVKEHHYAKGGSNTAVYVHGLYRKTSDEKCYGIVWWLPPTKVACQSVNKERWTRVLGLTRMVLLPEAPKNSASFLLSNSVRLIKSDKRFDTLVTYADESQGHMGRVYLAANWRYIGRTVKTTRWVNKDGVQVAQKATKNRVKAEMERLGNINTGAFHKHKYVMELR